MRLLVHAPIVLLLGTAGVPAEPQAPVHAPPPGVRLETLSWPEAAERLARGPVVVLPLGAAALQHGPHLRLGTDARLADYLAGRTLELADVVVAPGIGYHHYPAFDEYAGSTSLSSGTARDLTADVVRSLARHGPRRFYVLNTGVSTIEPLAASAKALAGEGILLHHADLRARLQSAGVALRQPAGNHADEAETSIMLHIDPSMVDMDKAVRDIGAPSIPFRLTRLPRAPGTYSASGVWGDATLGTAAKGRALVDVLLAGIRADIEALRRAVLPPATASAAAPPSGGARGSMDERFGRLPDECLGADERAIRMVGTMFVGAWRQLDAERLAALWAPEGDMVHPDGYIEGSARIIRQNRAYLFGRREYQGSRHSLDIGQVRCITQDVAIADAKWELRGVSDANGQPVAPVDGLCTLVLRKRAGGWQIEAYRYSMPPKQAAGPTVLQRPGLPERKR